MAVRRRVRSVVLSPPVYGHGYGSAQLKNSKGYKCCLGFACEALIGRADAVEMPGELHTTIPGLAYRKAGQWVDTCVACEAQEVNDDVNITNERREECVAKILSKVFPDGVEFIGEYETQ